MVFSEEFKTLVKDLDAYPNLIACIKLSLDCCTIRSWGRISGFVGD